MTYRALPFVTRVARPWSVRLGGAAHHLLTVSVAFTPCTYVCRSHPRPEDEQNARVQNTGEQSSARTRDLHSDQSKRCGSATGVLLMGHLPNPGEALLAVLASCGSAP
jgi:hypothetical protein